MFEKFFGDNGEKKQIEAEGRAMQFSREQGIFQVGAPESQTDIYNQEGKSDLIKWQQDLDEELEKLAYQLTGWVKRENKWVKTGKQPLCNDLFMDDVVITQCSPYLSRVFTNSNLQEERILKMLECTANTIADNMCDNFDIYGINFVNFDIVLNEIENFCTSAGMRALEGWTKKTDSTIMKRIESSVEHPGEQQKKGLFGF